MFQYISRELHLRASLESFFEIQGFRDFWWIFMYIATGINYNVLLFLCIFLCFFHAGSTGRFIPKLHSGAGSLQLVCKYTEKSLSTHIPTCYDFQNYCFNRKLYPYKCYKSTVMLYTGTRILTIFSLLDYKICTYQFRIKKKA
jgi:hypothetical protein